MSYKQIRFANGEFFHIYNRSVARENIFANSRLANRFLDLADYYRFKHRLSYSKFKKLSQKKRAQYLHQISVDTNPCVELFAYSLMSNHYHIVLRQMLDNGVRDFISTIQNGFAKYFNTLYERDGSLFTNPFKAVWIDTESLLKHIVRYVHLNHITSYHLSLRELKQSNLCSYGYYTNPKLSRKRLFTEDSLDSNFIKTRFITDLFGGIHSLEKFTESNIDYQQSLDLIKNLLPRELRKIRRVRS